MYIRTCVYGIYMPICNLHVQMHMKYSTRAYIWDWVFCLALAPQYSLRGVKNLSVSLVAPNGSAGALDLQQE